MLAQKELREQILAARNRFPQKERELCRELLAKSDNAYDRAFAGAYLGDALLSLGILNEALLECQQALLLAEENGYGDIALTLYNLLGIIDTHTDDEQGALDYYFKGIRLAKEQDNYLMCGVLLANIALLYRRVGAYDKAKATIEAAYHLADGIDGSRENISFDEYFYIRECAGIELEKEQPDEAGRLLERLGGGLESEDIELQVLYSVYYSEKADKAQALRHVRTVLAMIEKDNNLFQRFSYYLDMMDVFIRLGEYSNAEGLLQKAEQILQIMDIPEKWVKIAEYKIRIYEAMGDSAKATAAYRMFYEKDMQLHESRKKTEIKRLKKKIELKDEINKKAEIEAQQADLRNKSECDELTGFYNRRGIAKYADSLFRQAQHMRTPFAVVMLDVDFFKEYNDTYGHLAGDEALQAIAAVLRKVFDAKAVLGRYGGDEFIAAVLNKSSQDMEKILQNIKAEIAALAIKNIQSAVSDYMTVTIGAVNVIPDETADMAEFLHAADMALYEIKEKSRNGFCIRDSL